MANSLDSVANIGIAAAVIGGLYLVWRYLLNPVQSDGESSDSVHRSWMCEVFSLGCPSVEQNTPEPEIPLVTYDGYGCRTDIQRFCATENRCLDIALDCPRPITSADCYSWQHFDGTRCVDNPVVLPDPPAETDWTFVPVVGLQQCRKGNYSVSVIIPDQAPDCASALAEMCRRGFAEAC